MFFHKSEQRDEISAVLYRARTSTGVEKAAVGRVRVMLPSRDF